MISPTLFGEFALLQCVNQKCRRPFSSFVAGRLFHFDIVSISVNAEDEDEVEYPPEFDEIPRRKTFQYWLCGPCAEAMTLELEPLEGLRLLPLHQADPSRAAEDFVPAILPR